MPSNRQSSKPNRAASTFILLFFSIFLIITVIIPTKFDATSLPVTAIIRSFMVFPN